MKHDRNQVNLNILVENLFKINKLSNKHYRITSVLEKIKIYLK
jgi:hypothetical protein